MMPFLLLFFLLVSPLCAQETTLILVRHGQTDWNMDQKIQGHSRNPLNATGKQQAHQMACKLARLHPDIVAIYSSDLARAFQTAEYTSKKLALPVTCREQLREIKTGPITGLTYQEFEAWHGADVKKLDALYPDRVERWKHSNAEGLESFCELLERTRAVFIEIAEAHPGEKVAIFTHGMLLKVFIADLQDTAVLKSVPNGSSVTLTYCSETHTFSLRETLLH